MERKDFFKELNCLGVNKNFVLFDDNYGDDVYCVNKNNNRYEVFYRERGIVSRLHKFDSESDALDYLISEFRRFQPLIIKIQGDTGDTGDGLM